MQVSNYVDKVTSAHINRPKFIEWLSVMVRIACEIGDVVKAIPAEFAVRKAKGKQLDVIGSYFGLTARFHIPGTRVLWKMRISGCIYWQGY